MTASTEHSAEIRKQHAFLMRSATIASFSVAVILVVAKLAAWTMTGSVAVLSTLIDSLLDGAASLVTLFAVRGSLKPADREHRFGHGKSEPLAGLAQAAFIGGSALFLVIEAVDRLTSPTVVRSNEIGIAVMVLAIVLTFALVAWQRYVISRTSSVAISGDSLHYTGDLLMNVSVIASLLIGKWVSWPWLDPVVAILIALFLLKNAWKLGKNAIDYLMDKELPEDERRRIVSLCFENPDVRDVHDLRTRSSGQDIFIQLHLDLDPDQSLVRAHHIAATVQMNIKKVFPTADFLIHEDPLGYDEVTNTPFAYDESRLKRDSRGESTS